jgi:hypothetical protein
VTGAPISERPSLDQPDRDGRFPLLRGFDMQRYSPAYSWLWDNNAIHPSTGQPGYFGFGPDLAERSIDNAISWYTTNGRKPLISYQWHWHSPSGGTAGTTTFYTDSTTFDASRAVTSGTQGGSHRHRFLSRELRLHQQQDGIRQGIHDQQRSKADRND